MIDDNDLLSGQPNLLDQLSKCECDEVIRKARRKTYRQNAILFEQGDFVRGFYIIESGWIRTFYTAASGKEITVGLWSSGDLIGAPDLSFQNRLLAAEATKDSSVLILENADIENFILTMPSFAQGLISALSFKVRWATSIFDRLATESLISRVAQTVLSLAHLHGKLGYGATIIINEISHQDIANMIGAARPSVSLALRQLEASELIKIGRKRLIITNINGLKDYSKY